MGFKIQMQLRKIFGPIYRNCELAKKRLKRIIKCLGLSTTKTLIAAKYRWLNPH
jgi:hypothetical protein